jgi:AcrR family transcriptional regulator
MRAFTEEQREQIKEQLMEIGFSLFSVHGLKKTSVKDLTDAVGIAQGSFYLFFSSKEELYFEIIEREEQTIKEMLLQEIKGKDKIESGDFAQFLLRGLELVRNNPIIRRVYFEGELDMLMRKLPKERIENHMERDAHVLFPLLDEWEKKGVLKETNRDVIMSVIRAYYFALVHEQQLGSAHVLETAQFLAEAIAEKLIKDEVK